MLNSIKIANRAWSAATGYAVRMCEIVRRYSKEHRRDQPSRPRNLRRINLPIARPAFTPSTLSPPTVSSQPMEELPSDCKRKPDELLSPMSRVKRQDHGYNKSSLWSKDTWAQHLATNIDVELQNACNKHYKKWNRRKLPRKQYTLHGIRYQRSPSPKITKPYRISLVPHRPDHFEQAYKNLSRYDTPQKYHTPGRSYTPERFVTPDEDPSDEEMSDAQEDPLQIDIDEDVLQGTSFALVQPKETEDVDHDDTPESIEESEGKEEAEEEGSDWDEEGEVYHRKMLRGMAESYDEEGFRVPIDGVISPESQEWNEDHRRKLHERAALEQQTPSKPPKYATPTPPFASPKLGTSPQPASPDPLALDNTVLAGQEDPDEDQILSPKNETGVPKVEGTEEPKTLQTPPRTTYSTPQVVTNGDAPVIKSEDTEETEVLRTPLSPQVNGTHVIIKGESSIIKTDDVDDIKVAQTPAVAVPLSTKLENLNLSEPGSLRTPKSRSLSKEKEVRSTRRQTRLAEIEAAKNAYPLVPLSKTWDDKVRHAVNHGHGRFEATMFNKCVPEYSNDPSARSLWLDDAVINDYVAMVARQGSKDDRKDQVRSVAALSSFFFTKISSSTVNYSSCAGMLKRAGIPGKKLLDCEKVFIPINRSYHWTIAVIEPKIPEGLTAKEHKRKVTVYNSMGSSGGYAVAEIIMRWIQNELGASFKEEEWVIDPAGVSPQQRNTDDCGVFTCTTARQIMLRKYDDVKDRYKEGDIRDMRKRIVAELVHGDLLNKEESSK